MNKGFILILTSLFSLIISAQNKVEIDFDENEFNFGTIQEETRTVSHIFTFRNLGSDPFIIKTVTSSCGCTTPEWTKETIAPQATGIITVTYETTDRPGPFNKSVRVVISGSSGDIAETLYITGEVMPKAVAISEAYPYLLDSIALKSTIISFDTIFKGQNSEIKYDIANVTSSPIKIKFVTPKQIQIKSPITLQPNEEATILVQYMTDKTNHWGYNNDKIDVEINDHLAGELQVRATIQEDFRKLTVDKLIKAPIATLDNHTIKLGNLKIGGKYSASIQLNNKGIRPLLIRAITSDSSYLGGVASKSKIKQGKWAIITITIDATELTPFTFQRTIEITTNDPSNPIITCHVEWTTIR